MMRKSALLLALLLAAPAGLTARPPRTGPRALRRRPPAARRHASRPALPPPLSGVQDPGALAPFFCRLDTLGSPPEPGEPVRTVRILHFGDSHTAADFWTGRLRERLQARYGNGGPGILLPARPWRGYRRADVAQDFRSAWPAVSLRGRGADPAVGLPGAALEVPEGERLELRGRFGAFRVQVLGETPQLDLSPWDPAAGTNGIPDLPPVTEPLAPPRLEARETATPAGASTLRILAQEGLPFASYRLGIALPAATRLLGVELRSGLPGVILDELGLNGGELLDLEGWDPILRRALLAGAAPDLVVLAYGTNESGHPRLELGDYRARAERLLRTLKAELPETAFLVVGPLDRSARRRGPAGFLKDRVPAVARALREAARAAGCAFWDAREAMGGSGAIQRWRRQGLAQKDLVHLTVAGYARLADLMHEALDSARTASPEAPPAAKVRP